MEKKEAITFFKELAARDFLVFDTETTGLSRAAEVIWMSVVRSDGSVALDTPIKPKGSIPAEASAIHGITEKDVEAAPLWPFVGREVEKMFFGQIAIAYNCDFDRRILDQSGDIWGLPPIMADYRCAMKPFAAIYGEPGKFGGYKWQKLTKAITFAKGQELPPHVALNDCFMTLELIRKCAEMEMEG